MAVGFFKLRSTSYKVSRIASKCSLAKLQCRFVKIPARKRVACEQAHVGARANRCRGFAALVYLSCVPQGEPARRLERESLLVVVDCFSRFLKVAILKRATSIRVIEAVAPMSCQNWRTVLFENR